MLTERIRFTHAVDARPLRVTLPLVSHGGSGARVAAAECGGQVIAVEVGDSAPERITHFLARPADFGFGLKAENQIVVQVERLVAARGDGVHIHSDQQRCGVGSQDGAGFFDYFAAPGIGDLLVLRLDMTAGLQPALQAAVQN